MRNRNYQLFAFVLVPTLFFISVGVALALLGECRNQGYSALACMAMIQNGSYLLVR